MPVAEWAFLRDRIRALVGSNVELSDEELDAVIDFAARWRQSPLSAFPRDSLRWMAEEGGVWVPPVTIYDLGAVQTPVEADYLSGVWRFAEGKVAPEVHGRWCLLAELIVGVLDAWLARLAGEFDYSAEDAEFKLSQKAQAVQKLRDRWLAKAQAAKQLVTVKVYRADMAR